MTAVVGPSFGDAALHAAIANLVVMKRDASLALSGPPVIKGAIGEDVSADELGGPAVAHETSGSAHVVVDGEEEAIALDQALPLLHARRRRPARPGGAAGRARSATRRS